MNLLNIRNQFNLSQKEASVITNMPLRTFIRYEKDDNYGSKMKREMLIKILIEKCSITETKGLLTVEQIKQSLTKLFNEQHKDQIEFCYLFGSYAKGYAKETSDVDLCVSTKLTGLHPADGRSHGLARFVLVGRDLPAAGILVVQANGKRLGGIRLELGQVGREDRLHVAGLDRLRGGEDVDHHLGLLFQNGVVVPGQGD